MIFKVNKYNFLIYILCLLVSLAGILLYFITCICENIRTILMSIGASGLASVLLAFLIERGNNLKKEKDDKKIRESKLASLISHLDFVLQRTVWFYFCSYFETYNTEETDKWHIITYNELWEEFEKLANETENNEQNLTNYNEIIYNYYKHLVPTMEAVAKEMQKFETMGLFLNEEINKLNISLNSIKTIPSQEPNYTYYFFREVFRNITEIKEFSHFKSLKFYYKQNENIIKVNIGENNPCFEELKNAIPSNKRVKQ